MVVKPLTWCFDAVSVNQGVPADSGGGALAAEHTGQVCLLDQGDSRCPARVPLRGDLCGVGVGHEVHIDGRGFAVLQVAHVGDVGSKPFPRVGGLSGSLHDGAHLGTDELFDYRVDEALTATETVVNGGLADPGGSGDLLPGRAQPAAVKGGNGRGADPGAVG